MDTRISKFSVLPNINDRTPSAVIWDFWLKILKKILVSRCQFNVYFHYLSQMLGIYIEAAQVLTKVLIL